MNEIKEWNPTDVAEVVRAKIQVEFSKLIPDEVWDKLVRSTVNGMMNDTTDQWGGKRSAGIKSIIEEEVRKRVVDELKTLFASPDWSQTWGGNSPQLSAQVRSLVAERAPAIVENILGNIVQMAVGQIAGQLSHYK